jgi:hypothetical protein
MAPIRSGCHRGEGADPDAAHVRWRRADCRVGSCRASRHDNHLLDRRDQAWRGLQRDFLGRLRCGELVATGYQEPLSLGSERRPVPADLWSSLRPNFKNSTATGAGLKLAGILVRTAEDAPTPYPQPTRSMRLAP